MNPRRGASEVTLLAVGFLLLLAFAGGVLFWVLRFDTDPAADSTALSPSQGAGEVAASEFVTGPPGADGTRVVLGADGKPVEGLRSGAAIEAGGEAAYRSAPRLFDGTGRITGAIEAPPGQDLPSSWSLVVEPSRYVQGREHAAARQRLDFDGAQSTFELDDLPMGAYRIYAVGAGMDCPAHEVLLFRVEGQAEPKMHKHLLMRFHSVRGCSGLVLDAAGQPAEGLEVFLVPKASTPESQSAGSTTSEGAGTTPADRSPVLSAKTSGNGTWNVPKIPAGPYRLLLGNRQRPLIDAQDVLVQPASAGRASAVVESQLPPTATLIVQVMDPMGRGLPGARVRGIGPSPIDVEVDAVGVATARYVLPGSYRLSADYPALQLSGEGRFDVKLQDEPDIFEILCRP